MPEYPIHPYAEMFPMLSAENLRVLADDIDVNGQREPIVLCDGKILDGRNRAAAMDMLAAEQPEVEWSPEYEDMTQLFEFTGDALEYVVSKNLHRRHLTTQQRAILGVKIKEAEEDRAKERRKATLKKGDEKPEVENLPQREEQGKARDVAGKKVGVSGKTIDKTQYVLEKGSDEIRMALQANEISVSKAYKLVKDGCTTVEEVQPKSKPKADSIETEIDTEPLEPIEAATDEPIEDEIETDVETVETFEYEMCDRKCHECVEDCDERTKDYIPDADEEQDFRPDPNAWRDELRSYVLKVIDSTGVEPFQVAAVLDDVAAELRSDGTLAKGGAQQ